MELKSHGGDALKDALDQVTSSMPEVVDNIQDDFASFVIIIKGRLIAFFEYHNDATNLEEDEVPNFQGAVPFNHVHHYIKDDMPDRPYYKGSGSIQVPFERALKKMDGIFLDLLVEDVVVQKVLYWMKDHRPLDLVAPALRSKARQRYVDSAPFPQMPEDVEMAD